MIKVIVALFLISIDAVVSPNGVAKFDLLPDFIGYVILFYQFFRFRKDNHDKDSVLIATKQGMITSGVTFLCTYVVYLLDMYGILSKFNENLVVIMSAVLDLLFLVNIFMFIQNLLALQGNDCNYQVKRMNMLWKIMFLCIICEYISLPIQTVAMTFFFFEKTITFIFMFYIMTSSMTYKKKMAEKKI